jgi:hypothetical protein
LPSQIQIRPVNDVPTIGPVTRFTGPAARRSLAITHQELVAASGARDPEGSPLTFRVLSLQFGKLEKWSGTGWIRLAAAAQPAARMGLTPVIRPGERLRWTPAATGLTPAFTIRVNDGQLTSDVSQVSVTVGG